MKKSSRLKSILQLAEYRENSAVRTMVESRRKKEAEEQKLEQLVTFQDQYTKRLNSSASQGVAVGQLIEYREFLYKIGQAIKQQEQVIGGMHDSLGAHTAVWKSARDRKKGMDKIWDVTRQKELRSNEKREQTEVDDRRFFREE